MIDHFDLRDWRWANFKPDEVRCSHCGELRLDPGAMDKIQRARERYGKPVLIASGYRCPMHPLEIVKVTPGSHATGTAFDAYPASTSPGDSLAWFAALAAQGLYRFGFSPSYFTTGHGKLHVDWNKDRPPAVWYY